MVVPRRLLAGYYAYPRVHFYRLGISPARLTASHLLIDSSPPHRTHPSPRFHVPTARHLHHRHPLPPPDASMMDRNDNLVTRTPEGSGARRQTETEVPQTPNRTRTEGHNLTRITKRNLARALRWAGKEYGSTELALLRIMRLYDFAFDDLQKVLKSRG